MPDELRFILCLLSCLALASCQTGRDLSSTDKSTAVQARCCQNNERFPLWLVRMAEPAAPLVGTAISQVRFRKGHLHHQPEAIKLAQARLKPLDLLLFSSKGRLSGKMLPGLFGHVAIYLGNERDLRALGIWQSPEIRPLQEKIKAGAVFIEADNDGIHLSPPGRIFDSDRVVILRHPDRARNKRADLLLFARHLGGKFDFHFDSRESDTLFCAELADHVMNLELRRTPVYGRQTILPDAIIEDGLLGRTRLDAVLYLAADENGWQSRSAAHLLSDIAQR